MREMIVETVPVVPDLGNMGCPDWFHHHGRKMRLTVADTTKQVVVISASAATLTISVKEVGRGDEWFVAWEVVQSQLAKTNGRVVMSCDELSAAFGIADHSYRYGGWVIKRFGGDSANQGQYLRYQDFLNIPCPGTGHDGDPNISVELDDEIKDAIRQLVRARMG